jgi:hypothetical protein
MRASRLILRILRACQAPSLLLILPMLALLASPALAESWSFTSVSDTYSGLEGNLDSTLRSAFQNNPDLKFIISAGDFENLATIDNNMQANLKQYFPNQAYVPWFTTTSNHIVEVQSRMDFVSNTLGPRLSTQLPGMVNFREGPVDSTRYWAGRYTTYSFDYQDAHFIFLNQYYGSASTDPRACISSAPGNAYLPVYSWLEQDLAQNTKPIIFVIGHEPAFVYESSNNHCGDSLDDGNCPGNTASGADSWKSIRPERDKFWSLLRRYNVTAHISGHVHEQSARAVKNISDFPMAQCIDTEWNCYCDIEGQVALIPSGAALTPANGVVEFINDLTISGPVNIIRVNGTKVAFSTYSRSSGGALTLVNTFDFTVAAGSAGARTLYVDPQISPASCTTYNPSSRSCTGGTATAYKTMNAASAASLAGDLVYMRGGTYPAQFSPSRSGSAGSPITFKNYNGEAVTITGGSLDPAIQVTNQRYIVIDGFTVTNVGSWLDWNNATYITLQNSRFTGPVGSFTASSLLDSHYNKFLHNNFEDSSGDSLTFFRSDYNLIEGNTFRDADHSLFTIKCGDFNVARGNNFSNARQKISEVFDCDINEPGVLVDQLDSTKHNLIERNIYSLTAVNDGDGPYAGIQYAGQNGIIRNNIFYSNQGRGLDFTVYGREAQNDRSNRAYSNVFYNNTNGLGTSDGTAQQFSDNVIKNNILYKNKRMAIPWNDNIPGGSQMDNDAPAGFRFENNDVFNNQAGESGVIQLDFADRTLAQAQSQYAGLYSNNLEADPGFMNAAGHSFQLLNTSPLIDRGAFLTTTMQAGSGTSLRVADVGYFYDGYGISGEPGDLIQLQGQTSRARVIDIDYSTNTLTLDSALSWAANQGVALAFEGSAPDIGAYESTYINGSSSQQACVQAGGACSPVACSSLLSCLSITGTCTQGYCCSGACTSDTAPPARSNGSPNGTLSPGTVSVMVSLSTDENASCRYSAAANTTYPAMANAFNTNPAGLVHAKNITGVMNGSSYNFFVRCNDTRGNLNTDDYKISFYVQNSTTNTTNSTAQNITGDVNRDGIVDLADLQFVVNDFGKTAGFVSGVDLAAPFGTINLYDLMVIIRNWGRTS